MLAATAHSPEALSLPLLPSPRPGEAEQELDKADTTSQTTTTTCQEQRSDMVSGALHNHAEVRLGAGWSSDHQESLPTHCSSSPVHLPHRGSGGVEGKRAECSLQSWPRCSTTPVPPFTSLVSAAESSQAFCHAAPKIPRYPQADVAQISQLSGVSALGAGCPPFCARGPWQPLVKEEGPLKPQEPAPRVALQHWQQMKRPSCCNLILCWGTWFM